MEGQIHIDVYPDIGTDRDATDTDMFLFEPLSKYSFHVPLGLSHLWTIAQIFNKKMV